MPWCRSAKSTSSYRWRKYTMGSSLLPNRPRNDRMELRFWNDPETELPHIYAHGVTEEEVQQVLDRPGLDYPEARDARVRLGTTAAGRFLKVVYVPDKGAKSAFV